MIDIFTPCDAMTYNQLLVLRAYYIEQYEWAIDPKKEAFYDARITLYTDALQERAAAPIVASLLAQINRPSFAPITLIPSV